MTLSPLSVVLVRDEADALYGLLLGSFVLQGFEVLPMPVPIPQITPKPV